MFTSLVDFVYNLCFPYLLILSSTYVYLIGCFCLPSKFTSLIYFVYHQPLPHWFILSTIDLHLIGWFCLPSTFTSSYDFVYHRRLPHCLILSTTDHFTLLAYWIFSSFNHCLIDSSLDYFVNHDLHLIDLFCLKLTITSLIPQWFILSTIDFYLIG